MKLSPIICLVLSTLAAATDIRNHWGDGCKGGYKEYKNIAANKCASAIKNNPKGAMTVAFSKIPKNSKLNGFQATREGKICGSIAKSAKNGSKSDLCLGKLAAGGTYAGSSWSKGGGAALAARDTDNEDNGDSECTGEAAATAIVLDDGHKFDVSKMDKKQFDTLYDLAMKGTNAESLPKEFTSFEVEKDGVQSRLLRM